MMKLTTLGLAASFLVLIAGCAGTARPGATPSPSSPIATPTAPSVPDPSFGSLPPDGFWQVKLSAADLVAAGLPADVTLPGTYSWTFADGLATLELTADDGSRAYCEAEMAAVGGNVRLTYDAGGECGGEVDTIRFELTDDGLHMVLISTTGLYT